MRIIASVFAALLLLMAAMTAIVVSAVLYTLIKLLPLLLIAAVVVAVVLAVVRLLRPRPSGSAKAPARARALPAGSTRRQAMPGYARPHQPPTWGPIPQPGWVLMPVWMGDVPTGARRPQRPRDVIDAEVISTEDERG
jgi:hypothetical protein